MPNALGLGLSLVCGLAVACASPAKSAAAPPMQTTTTTTTTTQDYGGNVGEGDEHEYEPWTETWPAEDVGVRHRRPKRGFDGGTPAPPELPRPGPPEMPMPGAPGPTPLKPEVPAPKPVPRPLTAMDQGNSSAEMAITAAIRKEMMVSRELTFGAKNTKVITTGDRVTLRGLVATVAERKLIEGIARRTPGVRDVDSKLEVKN